MGNHRVKAGQGRGHLHACNYCTAQNFDGENIDEFDEFPAVRQYFPYQNFSLS